MHIYHISVNDATFRGSNLLHVRANDRHSDAGFFVVINAAKGCRLGPFAFEMLFTIDLKHCRIGEHRRVPVLEKR